MNLFSLLKISILISALSLFSLNISIAQPGSNPGQRGPRGPFASVEKQMVLDSIENLNEDQKLIIGSIYNDYEKGLNEARASASGDREVMRTQMTNLRDSKNEALKAVLTEEQFKEYEALMTRVRERMQSRRQRRNN